jgi:2-polyprenyl-6-methoxyphenol hydroxylase-like FAD-dependent oxidoreductase
MGSGTHSVNRVGGHAVVLGAGMAGLFAARVLSEFYDSVTVVERDRLADYPTDRKGVPQGRHVHMFLGRGTQILAELFPGLLDELAAAGAVVVNDGDLSRFYARTGRFELKRSGRLRDPAAVTLCLASRPFIEFHVRRRVATLPNVTFIDSHDVVEPCAAAGAVTGVRIAHRGNGAVTVLDSDLVVDAMGRAARTPAFLESLGYARPRENRSPVMLAYSSQSLCIPKGRVSKQLVAFNQGPGRPGGLLMACEHDTWMMAVGRSAEGSSAPGDFAEMLTLAQGALPTEVMDGLRGADAVGEIAMFRSPAAVWRRYEQLPRFPRGLLVMGDALCSPNPLYGQGMTMAAQQAMTLHDCLKDGDTDLAARFFRAAARDIGPTWARNQAGDRGPAAHRKWSMRHRVQRHMIRATLNAAGHDAVVAERLLRVTHLIDPVTRLRDPALVPRILLANLLHRLGRIHRPVVNAVRRLGQTSSEATQFDRRPLDPLARPRGALQ